MFKQQHGALGPQDQPLNGAQCPVLAGSSQICKM